MVRVNLDTEEQEIRQPVQALDSAKLECMPCERVTYWLEILELVLEDELCA